MLAYICVFMCGCACVGVSGCMSMWVSVHAVTPLTHLNAVVTGMVRKFCCHSCDLDCRTNDKRTGWVCRSDKNLLSLLISVLSCVLSQTL